MNHEVFPKNVSQSHLTHEWLAYLVANLPSLSILDCTIPPLAEIIRGKSSKASTLVARNVILRDFKPHCMIFTSEHE